MTYPEKILLAWGEAISGNAEIRDWLMANGFRELGLFCFALRNQNMARDWLMKNGHPHLMAIIRGAEGDKQAIGWLAVNGYEMLRLVALGADNEDDAVMELMKAGDRLMAGLALKIRAVKNGIEQDNNDVHRISPN
jgi:hypothetical protein